jgi:NADH-quinone oxidoreductase E subunit
MSVPEQPASFAFTAEFRARADGFIAKFPEGRQASAVIALLDLAQRQHGWLPRAAMDHVAEILAMAPVRVYEVASFYTMLNTEPVGEYHVQVCRTSSCWLRGSDEITRACEKRLGINCGERTADGKFSLMEVECLGACVNAPMIQINDDYYEDLDAGSVTRVLDALDRSESPPSGPQIERHTSAPEGGPTTLKNASTPDAE